MEDTSFIDLINDENINKMVIDKRLIPVFKKMMICFQDYFNYMGYTKTRDYKKFFENYLINPHYKLLIRCNKEPKRDNCDGFFNSAKRNLVIDESLLEYESYLLKVFTHEFIHFLVTDNPNIKIDSKECAVIYSFVDECLTEILTLRIFPLSYIAYLPQIEMLKFWLIINNKEINFSNFLNEGRFYQLDDKFIELMQIYDDSVEDDFEEVNEEKTMKKYLDIQKYLLKTININISSLEEYDNIISKVSKRPINDIYFMNKYYKNIENILCDNLKINDNNIRKRFMYYLKEYRKIKEYLENNNYKYLIKFYFDNNKYQIDERKNVYINGNFKSKGNYIILDDEIKLNIEYKKLKELKRKKLKLKQDLISKIIRYKQILNYLLFINNIQEEQEFNKLYKK